MRLVKSLLVSLLLVVAVSLPAAATQSEADIIADLLERWSAAPITVETQEAFATEAVLLFNDTIPGSACQAYADLVTSALLLADAIMEREVFVGAQVAFMIGSSLPAAKEACRISI